MLKLHKVCKTFKNHIVLDNVSGDIEKDKIIGLAGPSGGGKSTLLRCIQQLEAIDSGNIIVEGKSGFMFQDFQLFPHMTVLENLTYAPRLHNQDLRKMTVLGKQDTRKTWIAGQKATKKRSIHMYVSILRGLLTMRDAFCLSPDNKEVDPCPYAFQLLEILGIDDKANVYPHQLSGGQKQRVALARSLMVKPQLLLCDEPTSGLDIATIEGVVALLKSVRDLGVTMLVASHDLYFLRQIADRILILKDGAIVADLDPQSMSDPCLVLKGFY